MHEATVYTLLGMLVLALTILAAGWRLAAKVTRWADEVAANTAATKKLARKHGRLAGRVDGLEKRMDLLERP